MFEGAKYIEACVRVDVAIFSVLDSPQASISSTSVAASSSCHDVVIISKTALDVFITVLCLDIECMSTSLGCYDWF